jgi:Galactose oxidase, central domain
MRLILMATLPSLPSAEAQTSGLRWARANPTGVSPAPRIDAPIAYDVPGGRLVMFGGHDATGDRNDLWSYSVYRQQWTQPNPGGVPPNPRHGHTVTFDRLRERIIIADQGAEFFGDVWAIRHPG